MISVCILTKNSAITLEKTLDSLQEFDEIILLDNGSTDETLSIATKFPNVKIHTSEFIGFGPLRNIASKLAKNSWILALDSDEILSTNLIQEIKSLALDPEYAYIIPRHNYYNKRHINGAGWGNEKVARLYHRDFGRYSDALVHETLIAKKYKTLSSPLLHTPYRSTTEFIAKMQHYSTLFAEQNSGKKSSSFKKALLHGIYAFFRSYFFQKGIFCGKEGFIISLYNANTTFYKYLKLADKQ